MCKITFTWLDYGSFKKNKKNKKTDKLQEKLCSVNFNDFALVIFFWLIDFALVIE